MTTKAAFSPEQWEVVLEGPPSAGMIVATAARGGMIRDSIAMSKAYVEARAQHGESELLDDIVAAKATNEELDGYRRFVLVLANKVAAAHREQGRNESPGEAESIEEIATALGTISS
jgi:hypothetical protein